jgi:signal peptidase I
MGWTRYHHVEPGWDKTSAPRQPVPITDHLGYNTHTSSPPYWVPDLIVDCTAEFGAATDKVVLELTKAGEKFRAEFDNGFCRLFHVSSAADEPVLMTEQKTSITGSGRHDLRFANVDSRLTVWVDNRPLDFGEKADYAPPNRDSFKDTVADTHEPARIGATGNVAISKVSLWRDVYYTPGQDPKNPTIEMPLSTYYVQPGHYFCLGDNSASSSDGRIWGLVPERLMLGRAVVVYWPPSRIEVIK